MVLISKTNNDNYFHINYYDADLKKIYIKSIIEFKKKINRQLH